ncbi:MAG TPA: alpha/beta fold hydrolase [Candidatus Deferrimicrobiaceae bacterium]|nr:alpha/beta fold hydrolase [Candidatus Deferrimicrobiaceae bacterium]
MTGRQLPATGPTTERPWRIEGPAEGPPIVFVHGALMSHSVWRPQLDALSGRFRCLAVDLPGHGVLVEERFTLDRGVATVRAAIDQAGGRAVVVGLSLGGYVAMALAGRHADAVRGLVIAGCTREPDRLSRAVFVAYALALRVVPQGPLRVIVDRLLRRHYGPTLAAAITSGGYHPRGGGFGVRAIVGGRFRERLLRYGGPILAINGTHDLVFHVGARRFLAGVPDVSWVALRGANHLSNVDRPAEFSAAIEAFIGRLPE